MRAVEETLSRMICPDQERSQDNDREDGDLHSCTEHLCIPDSSRAACNTSTLPIVREEPRASASSVRAYGSCVVVVPTF